MTVTESLGVGRPEALCASDTIGLLEHILKVQRAVKLTLRVNGYVYFSFTVILILQ